MQKRISIPNDSIPRLDILDVVRGLALIAMATYHLSWDLELFGYLPAGTAGNGILKYYARAIATSFLFMVGFSLVLATLNGFKWRSILKRFGQVGGAALLISIATYFAVPGGWIFFGILHHIAAASLIGLIFVRLHWAMALLAALTTFALPYPALITTDSPWLSFVGLSSAQPNSNDFVPLLPWLSASLAGIAAAKIAIAQSWLEALARPQATKAPARQLKFLGRHSLLFYLVHQPVLIGIVWLATQIIPPASHAASFFAECSNVCEKRYDGKQCKIYCNCFEIELTNDAAQSSQLPAEVRSEAISEMCSKVMQETTNP